MSPLETGQQGWIGVDLDGTLAHYDVFRGATTIGDPIPRMVNRVKAWLAAGLHVRILTARALPNQGENIPHSWVMEAIGKWCEQHIGCRLPIVPHKDFLMVELWDDRAVGVITNTGLRADRVDDDLTYEVPEGFDW